jgi:NAD(P)-dependent dehydrogenase (short-subunit alcohol dehydrogenase family)
MIDDPTTTFRLDDRVGVVTGASSGLGARFARVLAAAGARVVLVARRHDRISALAEELPHAAAVTLDVTDVDAADRVMDAAVERFGRVDLLVNNAGISQVAPALELTTEQFRHELEVDLVAPYALARAVAAHLVGRGSSGSIVNVGSVMGSVAGGPLRAPGYAAAKGGLHNLTRELASEWARKGIRVNALAPGWFESEMSAPMWTDEKSLEYVRQAPMGRGGAVHELDGALLFLCSDASSFVTGQVLHVDGGWTIV